MEAKHWFGAAIAGVGALALSIFMNEPVDLSRAPGALSPEQFAARYGAEGMPAAEAAPAAKTAAPAVREVETEAAPAAKTEPAAKPAPRPAAPPTAAPKPAAPAGGATAGAGGRPNTISGKITWAGGPVKNALIQMTSDKVCEELCQGAEQRKEETIVNDDGTLANVVVYISKGLPKQEWPVRSEEVLVDQQKCRYHPHVIAFQLGQKVGIKNSDPTTHNVHFKSKLNGDWNMTQSEQNTVPPKEEFKRPEVGAFLKCDIHTWMEARVHIFDHPFFAVTGANGSFTLENVPPGTYTVTATHEKWGNRTAEVTVGEGAGATADFTFDKKKS